MRLTNCLGDNLDKRSGFQANHDVDKLYCQLILQTEVVTSPLWLTSRVLVSVDAKKPTFNNQIIKKFFYYKAIISFPSARSSAASNYLS